MSLSQISKLPPAQQQAILNGPALKPPPGVLPNLVDPPNENHMASAVTIVCIVAVTLAVLLRTTLQVFVMKTFRIPDALLVAGYANFIAYVYCVYRIIGGTSFFVHQWNVPVKDLAEFAYVIHMGSNFYTGVILSIKSAVILEWMHIFVPKGWRNSFFWCCVGLLTLNITFYLIGMVIENLSCTPYAAIWDKTIPDAKCIDRKKLDFSSSIINLVINIGILALPHRVIWQLKMSKTKKIGVSILFLFGVFACVAAAFRMAVTWKYVKSDDTTFTVSSVAMWALGEMTAVFVVLGIPHAPKVMREIGLTTELTDSLRSWIRLSSNKDSKDANVSWRRDIPTSSSGVSEPKKSTPSESFKNLTSASSIEMEPSGIVQTVQLSTHLSSVGAQRPGFGADGEFYRQHPWAERKRLDNNRV